MAGGGSRRRRTRCAARARSGTRRCRPCARARDPPSERTGPPSSAAMIWASEVLPSPGGPASSTWSSASPRALAASIATASCSRSWRCPTNSSRRRGRSVTLELVLGGEVGRLDTLAAAHRAPARHPRRAQRRRRAAPRRSRPQRRPAAARPRPPQSPARAAPRARARADRASPRLAAATICLADRRADLLAQLDDDPLGGPPPTPDTALEELRVAGWRSPRAPR